MSGDGMVPVPGSGPEPSGPGDGEEPAATSGQAAVARRGRPTAGGPTAGGSTAGGRQARHRRVRRRRLVAAAGGLVLLLVAGVVAWVEVPPRPSGPTFYAVDVLPGYTVAEVAQAVAASVPGRAGRDFAAVVHGGDVRSPFAPAGSDSLEGLLGPGTYRVAPGEPARQLLGQMVARFDQQAASAGLTAASASAHGLTPYQVVTVASIAQKEGYFDRYMGKVSRVVYNRLAAGMALDMTSTVLYALGQDGGPVTSADRSLASPYNTYLNTGLTPTPICLPSGAALAAAVSPPAGTWLYFTVVAKTGRTLFADTYTEQLANEAIAKRHGVGG